MGKGGGGGDKGGWASSVLCGCRGERFRYVVVVVVVKVVFT